MLYGNERTNPINHRKSIDTNFSCPRCNASSQFLYLFGHDGEFQKLRCSHCQRQFAPDKPLKPKKQPKFFCPVCGRGAHVTHVFSDGIRVRCNAHNHPNPEKRCNHLYNIPVAFDDNGNIVIKDDFEHMDGPLDGSKLLNIDPSFHFSRMGYSMTTVALATFFSLQARLPDTIVAYILTSLFDVSVHHSTINRWMDKVAVQLYKRQESTIFPSSGYLQTDFTSIFIDGKEWYWCTVKDAFLPLIVAWVLSPNKDTTTARNAMHMAQAKIDKSQIIPDRIFWISDQAYAFAAALPDAMEGQAFYHHQVESFADTIHNNAMERHYGDVKDITRRIRGFKSETGALSFLSNQTYAFDFLLEKRSLYGQTPADFLGIPIYDGYSRDHSALEIIEHLIDG
jgi:transposase-like protein/transcription elongation factor Elf1